MIEENSTVGINLSGKKVQLTKVGEFELKKKLDRLLTEQRPKVLIELSEARAQGDLSENADYDAAKNNQAEIEAEISRIEDILTRVEIISEISKKDKLVRLGTTVTYKQISKKLVRKVKVVGSIESNPLADIPQIGDDSPLAKALLGTKIGEVKRVNVANSYEIEVLKLS
ncbi:MAG: transcription elongation factor GreA [Mycoplasmataceae bacterium]|nr:transcription elongation factor GreA [Mycoplasmataceae bacterium]